MNSLFKHTAVMALTLVCVMGCDGKAQSQSSNATTAATEQVDAVVETVPQTLEDCVSFPLVDTGGEPEFQPDGTPTYPISFFGIAFGQKVDHLPPCPVGAWGIPKVGYAEEVCVWIDDDDILDVSKGNSFLKDASRHGWILYPWSHCKKSMSSVIALNEDGEIIYLLSTIDGLATQDKVYDWIYEKMGSPYLYAILDVKTKNRDAITELGLPPEISTLSGYDYDGVMVAIWQNDEYFIRLMPGINRVDIGSSYFLRGSRKVTNFEL